MGMAEVKCLRSWHGRGKEKGVCLQLGWPSARGTQTTWEVMTCCLFYIIVGNRYPGTFLSYQACLGSQRSV